ncbi:MAG: Rpn family recombination-promoting nuclease/putative transposase, partial [Paludibacteraceae bacterium]|nr:Rpn family recombination-promoting nuclease/putative transposase [Paludibacteraceae bacterium]
MAKYLDPKADLTFKKVFGEQKDLLQSFLNAILPLKEGTEIESLEYLSPEMVPENPAKKYSIVDVRCTDNHNRQFIVEMQMYWTEDFLQRALFNTSKAYVRPLEKGDGYDELRQVYCVSIINDIAFPNLKD